MSNIVQKKIRYKKEKKNVTHNQEKNNRKDSDRVLMMELEGNDIL